MLAINKRYGNGNVHGHLSDDSSLTDTSVRSTGLLSLGGGRSGKSPKPRRSFTQGGNSVKLRRMAKLRPLASVMSTSALKIDHDDENDDDSDTSSHSSRLLPEDDRIEKMEVEAQQLASIIRQCISTQRIRQETVSKDISVHLDRSKARLACQNSIGAVLSMRKVKRMQAKHVKLGRAVDYLLAQEESLRGKIDEAQAIMALRGFSSLTATTIECDLSPYRDHSQTVALILADTPFDDCSDMSDEQLLEELESIKSTPLSLVKTRIEI